MNQLQTGLPNLAGVKALFRSVVAGAAGRSMHGATCPSPDDAPLQVHSDPATSLHTCTNELAQTSVALLAHEMRNPLQTMGMACALLARHQQQGAPLVQRDALAIIDRQVTVLGRLVEDLLDVGSIRQGKFRHAMECVSLDEVLEASIEANAVHIQGRGLRVLVEHAVPPGWVRGDEGRLTQVFTNLLHNAAKFSRPGGAIHVKAFLAADGRHLAVSVRDEGEGVAPELLRQAFDLFAQGQDPGDRAGRGLGIGLFIVRSIVESHGGTVALYSEGKGKGCECRVTLPVLAGSTVTRGVPASSSLG